MLESSAARIMAVVLAVVIAVIIFLAPRSVQSSQYSNLTPQQARLELGRAYVEGSPAPMVGIKILQQVLKDDPENNYVRWYLGSQAINTGQFRKAIGHLSILTKKLKLFLNDYYMLFIVNIFIESSIYFNKSLGF